MDTDAQMASAITSLAEQADAADEGTTEEVARRLDLAIQLKLIAQQYIDTCEVALAERMEDETLVINGVGLFKRGVRRSKRYKDQQSGSRYREDMIHAIATKAALDPATGEVDAGHRNIARTALGMVLTYASLGTPKAIARRDLNIAEDDYWDVSKTPKVELSRGVEVH